MKRIGALVLVVAAAVLLSGAANGKDLQHLVVGALTLKDKGGETRAHFITHADGSPSLTLFDKAGKPRANLSMLAGKPALILFDKAGKPRAALGADADDGSPSLTLYDAKGSVLWQAPR